MAKKLLALSDADLRLLEQVLGKVRRQSQTTHGREDISAEADLTVQAPEIYVARVPADGISGLTIVEEGAADQPGEADCDIYRLDAAVNPPALEEVEGLSRAVYNLATTAIAGNTWVLITRDKFGQWYVAGQGAAENAWVEITSISSEAGTGTGIDYYQGEYYTWEDGSWVSQGDCWVHPINLETLGLGIKYPGRLDDDLAPGVGTGADWPVYHIYPGKSEVVKVTGEAVDDIYPGVLQWYNAGTWVDGDAIEIIEINGANLSGWAYGIYNWGED